MNASGSSTARVDRSTLLAAAATAPALAAARYLDVAARAARLDSTLDAVGDVARRQVGRELRDLSRALAGDPLDLEAIEAQIEELADKVLRASSARAPRVPSAPSSAALELLADLGHDGRALTRSGAASLLSRILDARADRSDRMTAAFLRALAGLGHVETPSDEHRATRHAIAAEIPFLTPNGGTFGTAPTSVLDPIGGRSWAANEWPPAFLLRVADRAGASFPKRVATRRDERDTAERKYGDATHFAAFGPAAKLAEHELEREQKRIAVLEHEDHAEWSAHMNTEIRRCDLAIERAINRPGMPSIAVVAGDQVRRAIRGMPSIRGLAADDALDLLLEYVELEAPDLVPPDDAPDLVRLRVSTHRGIRTRSRGGRLFTLDPRIVEVTEEEATVLRADDALVVFALGADDDGSALSPASRDADERDRRIAALAAEKAKLVATLAQHKAEERKADRTPAPNDGRPTRLSRRSQASKPTDESGGDFGDT